MVSAEPYTGSEYPLPVEEQTPLDEPLKIRWDRSSRSRTKMLLSLEASYEDASEDEPLIGCGIRAMSRQRTQLVIETVEEAAEIIYEAGLYVDRWGLTEPRGTTHVYERVRREVIDALDEQGLTVEFRKVGRPSIVELTDERPPGL